MDRDLAGRIHKTHSRTDERHILAEYLVLAERMRDLGERYRDGYRPQNSIRNDDCKRLSNITYSPSGMNATGKAKTRQNESILPHLNGSIPMTETTSIRRPGTFM